MRRKKEKKGKREKKTPKNKTNREKDSILRQMFFLFLKSDSGIGFKRKMTRESRSRRQNLPEVGFFLVFEF